MSNVAELARLIHLANFLSNVDDHQQQQIQLQQQLNNMIRPAGPQPLFNNFNLAARRPNFPVGGGPYRYWLNNNNVNRGPGLLLNPTGAQANLPQNQPARTNIFQSIQCPHCNLIQTSRNFSCSQITCGKLMYTTSNGRSEKCSNCYFPRLSLNLTACPLCFSKYNEIGIISLPAARPNNEVSLENLNERVIIERRRASPILERAEDEIQEEEIQD